MLLIITAVITALAGGVFFAWSCSVTPGLKLLPDKEYFSSFQSLNRAIQNPVFFSCFFGAAVLLPVCTWVHYSNATSTVFWLLLAATASYLAGVMGVTIFGNVPINNTIEAMNINLPAAELKVQRMNVESAWNRLNTVRACASVMSILMVVLACIHTKWNS